MNLSGYLHEGETVLDCVLSTRNVQAARIVTPSKVVLKLRGPCHEGDVSINVLTSSRERIREVIHVRQHDGHFAKDARHTGDDYAWGTQHGIHNRGPMVAPPGPKIVRTPTWRKICNMGNPMQNHTTSIKVPDYAVSGDLYFDPDRKALYLWFNTGQYDEWVPVSRRQADWNIEDKFSDGYIQNKPAFGNKFQYSGPLPPNKFNVPPGTQYLNTDDDTLYVLEQYGPNELEWVDISA
jgi:hypothetical protein